MFYFIVVSEKLLKTAKKGPGNYVTLVTHSGFCHFLCESNYHRLFENMI